MRWLSRPINFNTLIRMIMFSGKNKYANNAIILQGENSVVSFVSTSESLWNISFVGVLRIPQINELNHIELTVQIENLFHCKLKFVFRVYIK